MAVMNEALQKATLKKRLQSRGVDLSTVDLEALFDPTLTLPENIQNIEQQIGRGGRRTNQGRAQSKRAKFAQREAQRRHDSRPRWDQRIDESKEAQTVFADPNERQLELWADNPNEYDIEGVDTRKPREERQQAKNPGLVRQRGRRILGREFSQAIDRREKGMDLARTASNKKVAREGRKIMQKAEQDLAAIGDKMEKLDRFEPSELVRMDMDEVV